MANNLPLILTRDLTLSTASLQDTDAFLVVTGNESTVRVPWSSMTSSFITIPNTLPGTPAAEGEANQITWDSEGVYTYYNGVWGKTPRLQTNWDDLTSTTRFLRVDDTQNLSITEQATARENIGVVSATTTSPGLVQLASDITSTGVPTTDIVRTYVDKAITEADIDIEGTVSVDKVQNYTLEQQLQGQANLGIISATTTNEGLVQLADVITVSSNVPTSAAVKTYVDAQDNAIKSYVDAAISDIPDTSTYWTLTSDNILTPADPAPTVAVREIIGALNEYGNRAPCLTIHADTSLEVESGSRLYLQASDMDVNATTIAIEGACSVGIYSTANITMSTTNGGVQVYGGHCGVLLESNRGIIALEDSSTGIRMETTNSTSINLTSADDINLTSADDINLKSTSSGAINLTTQGNITIDAGNTLYLSDSGKYGPYIENGVAYNFGNSGGGGGSGDGYWSFNEGSELLYTNHSIEAAELETSTVETYYIRNRDAAVLTLEAAGNDIKMIADKVRLTGYLTLTDSSSNEWMNIYRENSADRFRISTAFSGIYIDANSKPITLDGEPINIVAQNGNYYMPVVGGSTCGQSYSASNIQETYPSVWLGSKCYPTYIGGTNIKLTPCSEGKLYLPDYTQIMVGDKTWESATAVDAKAQAYEVLLENLPVDEGGIINTPTPASGSFPNYNATQFELDERWVPAGKLNSISIMHRTEDGGSPTVTPTVYVCILEETSDGVWTKRAVSTSAVTQVYNQYGTWYFNDCTLLGNRIQVRALINADDPVDSTDAVFGLRAADRSLSPYSLDTSTIGTVGDYIAQCRLVMESTEVLDVASNTDLVTHVENMTMHLTADEHDALTDLIASGGGSGSGDSYWTLKSDGSIYSSRTVRADSISSCSTDVPLSICARTLYLSANGTDGPYIQNGTAYNFGTGGDSYWWLSQERGDNAIGYSYPAMVPKLMTPCISTCTTGVGLNITTCGAPITISTPCTLYLSSNGTAGPYIRNGVAYNFFDGNITTDSSALFYASSCTVYNSNLGKGALNLNYNHAISLSAQHDTALINLTAQTSLVRAGFFSTADSEYVTGVQLLSKDTPGYYSTQVLLSSSAITLDANYMTSLASQLTIGHEHSNLKSAGSGGTAQVYLSPCGVYLYSDGYTSVGSSYAYVAPGRIGMRTYRGSVCAFVYIGDEAGQIGLGVNDKARLILDSAGDIYLTPYGTAGPYIGSDGVAYNFGTGSGSSDSFWRKTTISDDNYITNNTDANSGAAGVRVLGPLSLGYYYSSACVAGRGDGIIYYDGGASALKLRGSYDSETQFALHDTSVYFTAQNTFSAYAGSQVRILSNGSIAANSPTISVTAQSNLSVYGSSMNFSSQSTLTAYAPTSNFGTSESNNATLSGSPLKATGFGSGTETAKFRSNDNLYAGDSTSNFPVTSSVPMYTLNTYSGANLVNCSNIVIDLTNSSSTPSSSSGWWYTLWYNLFACLYNNAGSTEFRTWYVTLFTGSYTQSYPAYSATSGYGGGTHSTYTTKIPASSSTQAANTVRTIRVTKAGTYVYGEWLS